MKTRSPFVTSLQSVRAQRTCRHLWLTATLILLALSYFETSGEAAEHTAATLTSDISVRTDNLAPGVDGFEFIPVVDIEVTELGWYDHGRDGFSNDHPMGIWDTTTRQLLATVTVDSSDPLEAENDFRYQRLESPVLLSAGTPYCIGGWSGRAPFDPYLHPSESSDGELVIDPLLNFVTYRTIAAPNGLIYPDIISQSAKPREVWFGQNFKFNPVSDTPYYGIVAEHQQPGPAATFALPQSPTPLDLNPEVGFDGATTGIEFIPRTDIWVTALEWYDHDGDGLRGEYPVGIYESASEQLLVSAVVSGDDPIDPDRHFRYHVLPSAIKLTAGTSYSVAGYNPFPIEDEMVAYPAGGLSFDPNLFFASRRGFWSDGLVYPFYEFEIARDLDEVRFGASFQFVTGQDLVIDQINLSAGTLTIGWPSRPGESFVVESSTDLLTWSELDDDHLSAGDRTTYQLTLDEPGPARIYLRVIRP